MRRAAATGFMSSCVRRSAAWPQAARNAPSDNNRINASPIASAVSATAWPGTSPRRRSARSSGKIPRVVDAFAKRLQVQEKLTAQIAGTIWDVLRPQGVAVIIQCQHFCMCYRGVKKPGSWTTTSKLHGCFLREEASRLELLTLMGLKRDIG